MSGTCKMWKVSDNGEEHIETRTEERRDLSHVNIRFKENLGKKLQKT